MATQIHVVLQQDVQNLGKSGDLVRVRPGYARNFLIPRGFAMPATAGNVTRIEELRARARSRAAKELVLAQETAKKLESLSVKIPRAVGEENKMYGSVTSKDIEDAFASIGVEVDRKKIILPDPIKTLGLSEVQIKLHHDVTAKLRVEVVKG
ncbi:MAG TPA: 50S ribosomal protein L9 [Polyangiaceae bacterium]|jgi:large subunit ribosomal protein L9|nr:50S ribosomal protein L9 [Polyangiaceae bacterium]